MTRLERYARALCVFSGSVALAAGGVSVLTAPPAQAASSVTDAVVEWGINPESGGGAYFGGCNFLSAGTAGDTGGGVWSAANGGENFYSAQDEAVSILKPDSSGTLVPATWQNKCLNRFGHAVKATGLTMQVTDVSGAQVSEPSYSENVVRMSGGTGTLDPATNSARIQWRGSFTVAYYGGLTYWSVTDPVLTLENGRGTLVATASGYASSKEDLTQWSRVAPQEIHLADIDGATVSAGGIDITPAYLGVVAPEDPSGSFAQVPLSSGNAAWWGSFPESWVNFAYQTGQASYWYTTGGGAGSIQERKVASPIRISATPQVTPATPSASPTPEATPTSPVPSVSASPTTEPTPSVPTSPTPAPTPATPQPGTSGGGESVLSGATLRWGMNQESNSQAYFGGCNFLSAGRARNTGGGVPWTEDVYAGQSGNVSIVKADLSGGWQQATWVNKCLDAAGNPVSLRSPDSHTNSQVVIEQGTGRVGADGSLDLSWQGSWTVAYYGGLTYWSVNNPKLHVDASGRGALTATLSGYGADMTNLSSWTTLDEREVTLADFDGIDVRQALLAGGFTQTPRYVGVAVNTDGAMKPQAPRTADNAPYWGSFPQSFVDYQVKTGQSSYWFTSGLRDQSKVALPVTVGYSASYAQPVSNTSGVSAPQQGSASAALPRAAAPQTKASARPTQKAVARNAQQAASGDLSGEVQAVSARLPQRSAVSDSALRIACASGGVAVASGMPLLLAWLLRRRLGLDPAQYV